MSNSAAYEAGRRWALMTNGYSLCDEPEWAAATRYSHNQNRADFVRGARDHMKPHRQLCDDCDD